MKRSQLVLSVALLLCFSTVRSSAQGLYFYLVNNSGQAFDKIYVSPSEQDRWGYNLIPNTYLYDGYKTRIDISESYGRTCYFDLKVVTAQGQWYKFSALDLCELYSITVNWNWTYNLVWE
ncbi:MAG: hypothetical protein ABIQ93_12525 [Saprospiraceae bacterium]